MGAGAGIYSHNNLIAFNTTLPLYLVGGFVGMSSSSKSLRYINFLDDKASQGFSLTDIFN
jgi:hypothetical protein